MTRANRKRHARAAVALAFVVPATLAFATLGRHPQMDDGSVLLAVATSDEGSSDVASATPWNGIAATTRAHRSVNDASTIEVRALERIGQPDLLMYFSLTKPADALPDDVVLLGTFTDSRPNIYEVPSSLGHRDGYLVLYSLPHASIVGWAPLARAEKIWSNQR